MVRPIAHLLLLVMLAGTVGLSPAGWLAGLACGVVTNVALARGLAHSGTGRLGPADRVTFVRATLVGGVTALTVDSFTRSPPVSILVALTVVALVLDAVDGWVARRTRTASALGARFDMEVDSFLILVLSVFVVRSTGPWVLVIGVTPYAVRFTARLLPWMRAPVPPRYWRKVVAATLGIVLTFAAADILPRSLTLVALIASLALLAESFGRDLWWLWHRRDARVLIDRAEARPTVQRGRARTVAAAATTMSAALLVWFALVAPDEIGQLTLSAFVRIPVEGLVAACLFLILPARARGAVAAIVGLALGLLTVIKILDMGFFEALDRPFNPVSDWGYLGPAVGVLSDSIGRTRAIVSAVAAIALVVAVLVFMTLSVIRLSRLVARHRGPTVRTVTALGVVWVLSAVLGLQSGSGGPIASTSAAGLAIDQVHAVRTALQDKQVFATQIGHDRFGRTPAGDLLTGLRGKDVVIAFVESYGQVAVQGSDFSPQVDAVLDDGTRRLRASGFDSRSAFLTSPTFGGISWLAHSTLQSGVWVDSQQRYNQLMASHRLTLSDAFRRAGWRTVGDVPSNDHDWPPGRTFYHYDKVYDDQNVGYAGPSFSYASMPDQYIWSAFRKRELARTDRAPIMAEIDLVSSHTPWAPLPHLVGWNKVGDGSIFDGMPEQGDSPDVVWRSAAKVRAAYGQSIEYSMSTLVSFVQRYADKNLVLVVLGDHQPATVVTGEGASHDVPITIIARDPAVMRRIAGWGWQDGLRPSPQAPVWPMDSFRDRFLTAYGPRPTSTSSTVSPR